MNINGNPFWNKAAGRIILDAVTKPCKKLIPVSHLHRPSHPGIVDIIALMGAKKEDSGPSATNVVKVVAVLFLRLERLCVVFARNISSDIQCFNIWIHYL